MRLLLILAVLVTATGCKRDRCVQSERNMTPAAANVDWRQCTDGKDRSVACELSGTHWSCTCSVGGAKGQTFQLASNGTASTNLVTSEVAREKCGWSFAP